MGRNRSTLPSDIFATELRQRGIDYQVFWEIKGPKNTSIAWITCYRVLSGIVLVQTFDHGGWNALTDCPSNNIADTIADVIARVSNKEGEIFQGSNAA